MHMSSDPTSHERRPFGRTGLMVSRPAPGGLAHLEMDEELRAFAADPLSPGEMTCARSIRDFGNG